MAYNPCGYQVDWARRPYSTLCRFHADESAPLVRIRWYVTDLPPLPIPSVINSRDWDSDKHIDRPIGEVPTWSDRRRYNNQWNRAPYLNGSHVCNPLWISTGQPWPYFGPPIFYDVYGLPSCCRAGGIPTTALLDTPGPNVRDSAALVVPGISIVETPGNNTNTNFFGLESAVAITSVGNFTGNIFGGGIQGRGQGQFFPNVAQIAAGQVAPNVNGPALGQFFSNVVQVAAGLVVRDATGAAAGGFAAALGQIAAGLYDLSNTGAAAGGFAAALGQIAAGLVAPDVNGAAAGGFPAALGQIAAGLSDLSNSGAAAGGFPAALGQIAAAEVLPTNFGVSSGGFPAALGQIAAGLVV